MRGARREPRPYRDVRREAGEEEWMQVPYGEGVASRTGPVPCVDDREVGGEALVRGDVGWVWSRESTLPGADPVGMRGRQHGGGRQGESGHGTAWSETPCTCGHFTPGTGRSLVRPLAIAAGPRRGG